MATVSNRIASLLSHLMPAVGLLAPACTRAFLRQTRFLGSDFQVDFFASISKLRWSFVPCNPTERCAFAVLILFRSFFKQGLIYTPLRTGLPLPQITPCPLLDRLVKHTHRLGLKQQETNGGSQGREIPVHILSPTLFLNQKEKRKKRSAQPNTPTPLPWQGTPLVALRPRSDPLCVPTCPDRSRCFDVHLILLLLRPRLLATPSQLTIADP